MTAMLRALVLAALVGLGAASHELAEGRQLSEEAAAAVAAAAAAVKPPEKNYDAALLGVLLLTFMAAYYLVNCAKFPEIQAQAWSLIVNSTAIFIAVMTYMTVKDVFLIMFKLVNPPPEAEAEGEAPAAERLLSAAAQMFGRRLAEEEALPTTKSVWCSVATFLFLFVVLGLVLVLNRKSMLRLKIWGMIGGHMMGFAAIDLFAGQLGHYGRFGNHPSMHVLLLLIYIVVIPIVCLPLYGIAMVSEGDDDEEQMLDMCQDFFCMGASFIIGMICRGFIMYERTKKAAEQHPTPDHPIRETTMLALVAFGFLIAGVVAVFIKQSCKAAGGCVKLVMNVLSTTLLLSASWCYLDALNWTFLRKFPIHQVMGRLMVAGTAGITFIFVLIVLTALQSCIDDPAFKKSFRSVYMMMALLVGLSWEHTFDVALEGSLEMYKWNPVQTKCVEVLLCFLLVVIFLPGFGVIMLPKHHDELKQFANTVFAPWQVCCDFPCDESTENDGSYKESADEDYEDADMEMTE